jgi:hypothetical protein
VLLLLAVATTAAVASVGAGSGGGGDSTANDAIAALDAVLSDTGGAYAEASLGQSVRVLDARMRQLYDLCAGDSVCSARFYLSGDADNDVALGASASSIARRMQQSTGSEQYTIFKNLLVLWAMRADSPLGATSLEGPLAFADYSDNDAPLWLRLMRTAHFCTDNEHWVPELGCVCLPEKVCHELDAAEHKWAIGSLRVALLLACVVLFSSGIVMMMSQRALFDRVVTSIRDTLEQASAGAPQPPAGARPVRIQSSLSGDVATHVRHENERHHLVVSATTQER